MSDPYKVLGISRDATDEQVKEAYREMAKKYHPDNYQGSPIADLANEKMKEINEAYDQIMNERKNRKKGGNSSQGYSSGYNPNYSNPVSYTHLINKINIIFHSIATILCFLLCNGYKLEIVSQFLLCYNIH